MELFLLGFAIGSAIGIYNNYIYKKILVGVANSHQNEKILGKWYWIKPSERDA